VNIYNLHILIEKVLIVLVFCLVLIKWVISIFIDVQKLVLALCRCLKCLMVFWVLKYIVTLQLVATFFVRVYFHACWIYVFIHYFYLRIKRFLIILSQNILSLAWFLSKGLIYIVNLRILIKDFFLIDNHLFIVEILIFLWIINIIFKQIDFLRNGVSCLFKLIKMLTVRRVRVWVIIFNFNFFFYFYYVLPNIFYLLTINFILINFFISFDIIRIC
jgi:hypothetical protein